MNCIIWMSTWAMVAIYALYPVEQSLSGLISSSEWSSHKFFNNCHALITPCPKFHIIIHNKISWQPITNNIGHLNILVVVSLCWSWPLGCQTIIINDRSSNSMAIRLLLSSYTRKFHSCMFQLLLIWIIFIPVFPKR